MGCSSSALGKAGDGSRFRSATSNECFSTTEESESCTAQPKPCSGGREPAFCSNVQRGNLPPAEKPKASVMPTANGVRSRGSQPPAEDGAPTKDAGEQSGPTEETGLPEGPEECPPGGKGNDAPGRGATVKDVEPALEVRSSKEKEPSGTAGARDGPGAGEGAENPQAQAMGLMTPAATAGSSPPLETAGEPHCQEAAGEDAQPRPPGSTPRENRSPGAPAGSQLVQAAEAQQLPEAAGREAQVQARLAEAMPEGNEKLALPEESLFAATAEEPQLQRTSGEDAQPQPLQIIPKEDAAPEVQDRSLPALTPAMTDPARTAPQDPGIPKQVQPEGIAGGVEHRAEVTATAALEEGVGESPSAEEEHCAEEEMGEKVETETESEKASEEAETQEEETGEAVDLSAAT